MTDMRRIPSKDGIAIDDKNYLIKLLSELQIVKWMPAQYMGIAKIDQRDALQMQDNKGDYSEYKSLIEAYAEETFDTEIRTYKDSNPNFTISKLSQETLLKLFPTHEWVENGTKYRQEISQIPATRLETALLRDGIRNRMMEANARITGICPIRENLTMRCLDEMIRLATINCAERGLFFSVIRDELRMTLCCYKTLLKAGVEYGNDKFRQSQHLTKHLEKELQELKEEKEKLNIENQEMRISMKLMDRKFTEERNAVIESRKNKLGNLKRTCDQFIVMLETIGVEKNQYRHLI